MLYLTLRQYEYVCAIGRHGSLSAAALRVNVSQPALSNALTRVESHLGYPLFSRRRGAAMALTPQGRKFIEEAEALLNRAALLENSKHPVVGERRLRLGCFIDLAPFLLAQSLHKLRQALPDVVLTHGVETFEGLISGLIDGRFDCALTYDLGMDAGFTCEKLFDSTPRALLSVDHPLAESQQVTLAELADFPLILSKEGLSAQHVLALCRRKGLNPTISHRAESLELQRSLAAHGEGVGISYASPTNRYSYDQMDIVSLPITDTEATEAVVLARHGTGPTDSLITAAEHALIKGLQKT
ncbi:DNA-binding transcriptional regulator, LysR family [Ruegeria halocynthiae]|uniref:DNA-binding transcriptional regulator, LysR family n=1 Tax=Ruegeria halocynthiae TaxID=985054 RepID=A0A1H2W2E6_9RHOB|nr:LysR family transcriptional regulator [Ruegeria halocynthiae]SDW74822.1 DNA-binding transcriptional regulator, LysR family [Ruegeria halocynthiae]